MQGVFTGIVEEIGTVQRLERRDRFYQLSIKAKLILGDLKLGDSVSVNGVCLTVTDLNSTGFQADIMAQTLRLTSLNTLSVGSNVNLERAMSANGRFGGHMVSGHIDGIGHIRRIERETEAIWLTVQAEIDIMKYMIKRGSIAIDGVSLTVAVLETETFKVSLIPHTAKETILGHAKIGDSVNLECDQIGKYVEKLMENRVGGQSCLSSATLEAFLRD